MSNFVIKRAIIIRARHRHIVLLSILIFLFCQKTDAQQWQTSAEAELRLQGGTQDHLPFWMYSNTRGRLEKGTHTMGRINLKTHKELSLGGRIEAGAGVVYRNGTSRNTLLDEAYLHFENSLLQVSLGIKQQPEFLNGLSATGMNMLWSQNAMPLPGLQFGTSAPLYFNGEDGLGVEMFWGDFFAGEHGELEHVKIHRKSLHLVLKTGEAWSAKMGLYHFAQWGGEIADSEGTPFSFPGYLRAVTGRQSDTPINHLGSWQGSIRKSWKTTALEIFTDVPFKDVKGAKLGNLPDGRFGIFWSRHQKDYLLHSALYEIYTTTGQGAKDDYLNHKFYGDGWTFNQRLLAVPFFTYSEAEERIINNRFTAHHFGVAGDFGNYYDPYPYRLLFSYSRNTGTVAVPFPDPVTSFTTYFTTRLYNGAFLLNLHLASDFGSKSSPNHAGGVSLIYRLTQN